jgi:hypothetical protein
MWRLHAETPVWSDLVELLSPISDHYSAFPQRVEHLPSEAFSAELVVETLMLSSGRTPSEHVAFGSCLSRFARFLLQGFQAFGLRLIHLAILLAPPVKGGD